MMDSNHSPRRSSSPASFIYTARRTQHDSSASTLSALLSNSQRNPHSLANPSAFSPVDWRSGEMREHKTRAPSPRAIVGVPEDAPSRGVAIDEGHAPPPPYSAEPASHQQRHRQFSWARDLLPLRWRQHQNRATPSPPAPRRSLQPSWISPSASPGQAAPTSSTTTSTVSTTHDTQTIHLTTSQHYPLRIPATTTTTTTTPTTPPAPANVPRASIDDGGDSSNNNTAANPPRRFTSPFSLPPRPEDPLPHPRAPC